jgi:Flp pilus assembly protein TadG
MLPILILVALAGIQLGLVAYSASQAGTAARAAARMAARSDPPVSGPTAGQEAVSDWLHPSISMGGGSDSVSATASVEVPSLLGVRLGHVQRTATMPREDDDGGGQ